MSEESKAITTTEDPYVAMEKADEHQVLAEMQGRFIQELVYSFNQGGQEVTGLSLAGVRETVRTMNSRGLSRIRISAQEPKITETDDYYQVMVYAEDVQNGGGAWGAKRQEKRHARGAVNVFAMEMALSKAQRNAQRALIPEYFVKAMIEEFMSKKGTVRRMAPVQRPAQQPTKTPPVETRARELEDSFPEGPAVLQPKDQDATAAGHPAVTPTVFWQTSKKLGFYGPKEVYAALGVKGGTELEAMGWAEALERLREVSGKEAE